MFPTSVERPRGTPPTRPADAVKKFILSWLINTLAVLVAFYLVSGIHCQRTLDLFVASLLLGIFNAVLRPVLILVALPLVIMSLGLFTLIINGMLLYFVGFLLQPHFYVDSFWSAFWGALLISIVSTLLNLITGVNRGRIRVSRPPKPPGRDLGGDGPVIDV